MPSYKTDEVRKSEQYSQCHMFAKSAIAAMQPAIDKAVAEERARCVSLAKDNMRLTRADLIEAIEQGSGCDDKTGIT